MRTYSATYQHTRKDVSITNDGTCTVIGIISEGRTFRVFKARLGTKIVILKAPVNTDTMSVELLRREYELCKGLSHPCVVSIVDFMENSPVGPAIVMEFIDGFTLDEFVAHGATKAQRKAVLMDILDGVDYLHHRGILHNDLKPDNIIVNSNGTAKIIDFGLSVSDDSAYSGCIGGSDIYTAPEIMKDGVSAGSTSDIYTIGLLIRLLFGGMRYNSIASKCTREIPAKRYTSINNLRKALERKNAFPWVAALGTVILLTAIAATPLVTKEFKKMKYHRLEQKYEAELKPAFSATMDVLKQQKYREFALVLESNYIQYAIAKIDSVGKAHPMSESGELSTEYLVFNNVVIRQHNYADSIAKSLPSMFETTLTNQELQALSKKLCDGDFTTEP